MNAARPAAFSRTGALALVAGGFALFLALLWLIGAGEGFGGERGQGQAHAAAKGLNGYAGLVRLVEAQGYAVNRSRNPESLKTAGLLVLTPPIYSDAEEIAKILRERASLGPTLVIMPKWWAAPPPPQLPTAARGKFKRGWVTLETAEPADWAAELPAPFTFTHNRIDAGKGTRPAWRTADLPAMLSGRLPTGTLFHAVPKAAHDRLVIDSRGRILAFRYPARDRPGIGARQPIIVLADPDLANNYGLADPARARAAMALIDDLAGGDEVAEVTFDMTLNGFGASENLLTLAFRPPFLAATLSLIVALLIVAWRAFQRFGPPAAAAGPDIAFGKRQLILNGAGLILRARRFALLAAPYAALSARRIAERLGLARPDPEAIDAALARRLPAEEPFTRRAARLEAARKPADILAAARAIDELATKLSQGQ